MNDFAGMKILRSRMAFSQWSSPSAAAHSAKPVWYNLSAFFLFSFLIVGEIFAAHGLTLFDVEEIPTHGGSLRIYGKHDNAVVLWLVSVSHSWEPRKSKWLERLETYLTFGKKVKQTKRLFFWLMLKPKVKWSLAYGVRLRQHAAELWDQHRLYWLYSGSQPLQTGTISTWNSYSHPTSR